MGTKRIIVGISGASGFLYGVYALQLLRAVGVETHLVISRAAHLTREYETTLSAKEVLSLADYVYDCNDIGAAIASGSFNTNGMLVAPCSMHSLSAIAHGASCNLLTRAADVMLKERKRLVLMVRETPYNMAHIKNMALATEMGAIIFPPVPALYHQPATIEELLQQSVMRALTLMGVDQPGLQEWQGKPCAEKRGCAGMPQETKMPV